jgi:ribulose-phosphate 3-epimerase
MTRIKLAPSILAADFARLGDQVREAEEAGADRIHVDVMDGHFVPNLSMGPAIVQSLRPVTRLPLEAHLMVTNPEKYLEPFARAGADSLLVHAELPGHVEVLRAIRRLGKNAGTVINPETPASLLTDEVLREVCLVLVMTVHPGFGGQAFMGECLEKVREIRRRFAGEVEVDGGVDPETGRRCVEAGADVLVAGSSVFGAKDGVRAAMCRLAAAAAAGAQVPRG